jgi:hypothetical protein
VPFSAGDRLVLGWVCGLFPNARDALAIIRPETVMTLASRRLDVVALKGQASPRPSRGVDELRQLI